MRLAGEGDRLLDAVETQRQRVLAAFDERAHQLGLAGAAGADHGDAGQHVDGGRQPLGVGAGTIELTQERHPLLADQSLVGIDPFQKLGRCLADLLAGHGEPVLENTHALAPRACCLETSGIEPMSVGETSGLQMQTDLAAVEPIAVGIERGNELELDRSSAIGRDMLDRDLER